jgi:hypothetical protein
MIVRTNSDYLANRLFTIDTKIVFFEVGSEIISVTLSFSLQMFRIIDSIFFLTWDNYYTDGKASSI